MSNEILKETLLHYINLDYYANEIDEEFQTLLEELEDRCAYAISSQTTLNTKMSYNVIMRIIKEEVESFERQLEERLEEEAERVMNEELEFLDETYNKRGGINGALLALSAIPLSRLLFAPVSGNDSLKQFTERTGKNITQSYDKVMRAGYLFGQNTQDVINNTKNSLKQVSRGMKNGIRTVIPAFAKTADRIIFLNNNVEVVYCATLDGSTCIMCGSCHGLHYKSISEAPSIPIHANCRCIYLSAANVTEPMPTFEEYVESLPEEEQRHILGKNQFELWKKYNVSLNKFINDGSKLEKGFSFNSQKSQDILNSQQKVNKEQLSRVIKGLEKTGYDVRMGKEIDRYLDIRGNEAITMPTADGKTIIMYHSKLSASGMFEEIIHSAQLRKFGVEYCDKHYHELEVAAKNKLLKYANNYGITESEKGIIQEMLDFHKSQIE